MQRTLPLNTSQVQQHPLDASVYEVPIINMASDVSGSGSLVAPFLLDGHLYQLVSTRLFALVKKSTGQLGYLPMDRVPYNLRDFAFSQARGAPVPPPRHHVTPPRRPATAPGAGDLEPSSVTPVGRRSVSEQGTPQRRHNVKHEQHSGPHVLGVHSTSTLSSTSTPPAASFQSTSHHYFQEAQHTPALAGHIAPPSHVLSPPVGNVPDIDAEADAEYVTLHNTTPNFVFPAGRQDPTSTQSGAAKVDATSRTSYGVPPVLRRKSSLHEYLLMKEMAAMEAPIYDTATFEPIEISSLEQQYHDGIRRHLAFHGDISRDEAEKRLRKNGLFAGTYLIRTKSPYFQYVISLATDYTVEHHLVQRRVTENRHRSSKFSLNNDLIDAWNTPLEALHALTMHTPPGQKQLTTVPLRFPLSPS
eukprot:m.37045 g.37045  ORF g.37045 m.37045 type:complete len:416 (+) comp10064_c0_seq1:339-1586(+)